MNNVSSIFILGLREPPRSEASLSSSSSSLRGDKTGLKIVVDFVQYAHHVFLLQHPWHFLIILIRQVSMKRWINFASSFS